MRPVTDDDEPQREEDRERYRELLEELRTILPGVQVLFAFMLTAPFSARFEELDDFGNDVYSAALLGVALTIVILMAPTAYHRLAPDLDRSERLGAAVLLTIIGMGLLSLTVATAVFVVARFVFHSGEWGVAFGGVTLVALGTLWFALPLLHARRLRSDRR